MTALKPIENRIVVGVAATRYQDSLNDQCSHPECSERRRGRKGAHHIFPRSLITNDSWFVKIEGKETTIIPHVTWLCPSHHDDVEEHRAWIKLESDQRGLGQFVWYDRIVHPDGPGEFDPEMWNEVGPLNPQPGGRAKSNGKPKKKKEGAERRERVNISFSKPKDARHDWAGIIDDALEQFEEIWSHESDFPPRKRGATIEDAVLMGLLYIQDYRDGKTE